MFAAIKQGHFDLVYQSSYAYTYQQHVQHATQWIAHKEDLLLQQTSQESTLPQQTPVLNTSETNNQPDEHPSVSLQAFLQDYPAILLPGQVEAFTNLIAPLLAKQLPTADVHLQEKIIHYLQ